MGENADMENSLSRSVEEGQVPAAKGSYVVRVGETQTQEMSPETELGTSVKAKLTKQGISSKTRRSLEEFQWYPTWSDLYLNL